VFDFWTHKSVFDNFIRILHKCCSSKPTAAAQHQKEIDIIMPSPGILFVYLCPSLLSSFFFFLIPFCLSILINRNRVLTAAIESNGIPQIKSAFNAMVSSSNRTRTQKDEHNQMFAFKLRTT